MYGAPDENGHAYHVYTNINRICMVRPVECELYVELSFGTAGMNGELDLFFQVEEVTHG